MSTTTEHEAITEHSRLETDIDTVEQECTAYIRDVVDASGASGVTVGLSGSVDSTTAATLAVNALGPDNVYGLVLPAESTPATHPPEGS